MRTLSEEQKQKMREGKERAILEKKNNPNAEVRRTPMKAIRAKCLDCCCGSSNEVKLCTVKRCPLYKYRFGKRPSEKSPVIFEDEIEDEDFIEEES